MTEGKRHMSIFEIVSSLITYAHNQSVYISALKLIIIYDYRLKEKMKKLFFFLFKLNLDN
jgi:hypothetical protein